MISLLLPSLFLLFQKTSALPAPNPKYEHAKQIFERLIEARGDKSMKAPELLWTVEAASGAYYMPGTNQITLEEKAYEVCTALGDQTDAALAFILAHELIHYYKQHGWEANFGRKFSDQQIGQDVDENLRDMKQQETESDLLGGFLAYTAGYNTVGVAPQLLRGLYDSYPNWPKGENSKYPTLDERILIARTTEKDLTVLIRMFETANLLVAVERYDAAMQYYNYILSFYKSRELVSNQGVVTCMAAMKLFEKGDLEYLYPLELDAEARVRLGTKGFDDPQGGKAARDSLLQSAIGLFEEALSLDRGYHTARLNMASAYALLALSNAGLGEEEESNYDFANLYAKQVVRRAQKESNPKLTADAVALMGVIAVKTGEGDAAALFESAKDKSNLAQYNLDILRKTPASPTLGKKPKEPMVEQIEEFPMDRFAPRPSADSALVNVPGKIKRQWGTKQKDLEHSRILIDVASRTDYALFQISTPSYPGQTLLGLKAGASRQDILDKYLQPDREVQLPNGHLMVYGADEIIFWLDENQKLARWCIYRMVPK